MKIQVKGEEQYLEFVHEYEDIDGHRHPVSTTAKLIKGIPGDPQAQVLAIGVSNCHYKDQFDRAKGRKVALKYMLESIDGGVNKFDQPTRTEIWKQYLKTVKVLSK